MNKKELLKQIEELHWYKDAFDFIIRNYNLIELSLKFSDHRFKIINNGVVIGPKFRLADSLVEKEFESMKEVFEHLMQWYDTDKQLENHKNIPSGNSIIIEDNDGEIS